MAHKLQLGKHKTTTENMRHILPFNNELFRELSEMINSGLRAFETEADQLFAGQPNSRYQLYSTDNGWAARIDLPGYAKKEINLNFKDQALTLTAENETRGTRNLKLPLGDEVETCEISAKLEHGILEITLPKKETADVDISSIEIK